MITIGQGMGIYANDADGKVAKTDDADGKVANTVRTTYRKTNIQKYKWEIIQ